MGGENIDFCQRRKIGCNLFGILYLIFTQIKKMFLNRKFMIKFRHRIQHYRQSFMKKY